MKYFVYFVIFSSLVGFINCSGVNVAVDKNASHLETYSDWTADNAVDGCVQQTDLDTAKCCSASLGVSGDNFWEVDLGQNYTINSAVVYGRLQNADNQINGFVMYVMEDGVKTLVYNDSGQTYPTNGIINIMFSQARNTSVVRVERPESNGIITLCEVQVYAVCDDGFYGDNCIGNCGKCVNGEPCNKDTGVCDNGCGTGWQGDMCKARENVAFNATASQTSDLTPDTTADKAVDGCTDQNPASTCYSSAAAATENEVIVNLGEQKEIGRIKIYGITGKAGELSGFLLYGLSKVARVDELLYNNSDVDYGTGVFDIMIEPSKLLQEITVRRTTATNESLTICEIEAYEVCQEGYGELCENPCGNCLDNVKCHGISGRCVGGCAAGWSGDTCNTSCASGKYGENCNGSCGVCLKQEVCEIVSGSCPNGCDRGYNGLTCHTECTNNMYGFNCNETCGKCMNSSQCDTKTGNCSGACAAGYQDTMCTTECVSPAFGPDCLSTCNCANNDTCDFVDGTCPNGCENGWTGSSCDTVCENGTYGEDCSGRCGECFDDDICDVVDGRCPGGCAPGWQDDTCSTVCEDKTYGQNCSGDCGNCRANASCNPVDGVCEDGCSAGWQGNMCIGACPNGTFGEDCAMECFCAQGVPCDKETGLCPDGCGAGFTGEFCHIDLNRAKNKPAMQSSTADFSGFLWNASLALDGDFSQSDIVTSRTCSSTEADDVPFRWWSVDLENVGVIDNILVYGPTDTAPPLENFNLYLSNNTLNISMIESMDPHYNSSGIDYDSGIYNVTFDTVMAAKWVYIELSTPGQSLTLCEVRVFGECPDSRFGPECLGQCYCADDAICDKDTGICPDGNCAPGWTTDQCDEMCANGTYGPGCSGQCGQCAGDVTCDHVTGSCDDGCSAGWLGTGCNATCAGGFYGQDCNDTCGNCKNNAACNHVTGNCPAGCAAGYQGDNCTQGCVGAAYGEDCASDCGGCINDTICNSTNGSCEFGCADGYEGDQCVARQVGNDDSSDDDSNLVAILAGVFGAIAFIVVVAVAIKCYKSRSSDRKGQMTQFTSPYAAAMMESEHSMRSVGHGNEGYQAYYNVNTKL